MDPSYNLYYEFVKTLNPYLSLEDYDLLFDIAEPLQLEPKSIFVELNKKPENIYLLVKGVARSYVVLDSGKEITKSLFTDMELCSSLSALMKQEPSRMIFETLSDCFLMKFSFVKFRELCDVNMGIMKLYVNYLERKYAINEIKHLDVLSKDSKTRYLDLRDKIPNIDNLIPQYQIASYINVTPVQLSRIRSTLNRN